MQQYKLYTLTPELKQVQKHLLKYDRSSLNEFKDLTSSDSNIRKNAVNKFLRAHMPQDEIFDLSEVMGLSFSSDSSAPYTLNGGVSVGSKQSFINYQDGDIADSIRISAGVELELNRFSDKDNIPENSYMFFDATVKATVVSPQDLGEKLKELFGFNHYYAVAEGNRVVIKCDTQSLDKIVARDYKLLAFFGLGKKFAPAMLQPQVLEHYLSSNEDDKAIIVKFPVNESNEVILEMGTVYDTEKSITVKLDNKDIAIPFIKDETGAWQAHVPEVLTIDSLKIITPASDKNDKGLFLNSRVKGSEYTVDKLTELERYAIISDKFEAGFNLATFKEYATLQGKCELLPSWAELIASDRIKYQGVLDHYLNKFDQNKLQNPLYLVSFMQHYKIPFQYNDNSLPLMFSALVDKSGAMLYGKTTEKDNELSPVSKVQQELLQEHSSSNIVFARNLTRTNSAIEESKALRINGKEIENFPNIAYKLKTEIVLHSPATIISRAASKFIARIQEKLAAKKLQAAVRSWLARLSYGKAIKSAITIEAAARRQFNKHLIPVMQHSSLKIKTFTRMVLARDAYGRTKKVIPKKVIPQKFITQGMKARISKDNKEAFHIVNTNLETWYNSYFDIALRSVKNGNSSQMDNDFAEFTAKIENLHTEIKVLLDNDAAAILIAGKEKILASASASNNILYSMISAKNDLYAKYVASVIDDNHIANSDLLSGFVNMYWEYSRGITQLKNGLSEDYMSSLNFVFFESEDKVVKAESTTIEILSNATEATISSIDEYMNSFPSREEDLDLYTPGIKESTTTFREGVHAAYVSYYDDVGSIMSQKEALKKFNLSIKKQYVKLQEELTYAIPHVKESLLSEIRRHDNIQRHQMMPNAGISANNIFLMAANIVQRSIKSYFKTSKHKKRMAELHNFDFKFSRSNSALKIESAVRMFLAHKHYIRIIAGIKKLQRYVRSCLESARYAKVQKLNMVDMTRGYGAASSSVTRTRSLESKAKFSSGFSMIKAAKSGFEFLKRKTSLTSKQDPKQAEMQEIGLAALAAEAMMKKEPEVIVAEQPLDIEQESQLDPFFSQEERNYLTAADASHLKRESENLAAKIDMDIILAESEVASNPRDKNAIAKLRYMYIRHKGEKEMLTDGAVIAKAKLELVRRALLDGSSHKSDGVSASIAASIAKHIKSIPINPVRINKENSTIFFNGGYAWPRLLDKLANNKTGLLQNATSVQEREIWFASMCSILRQENSLTPTIGVGGGSAFYKEIKFIDNAITEMVSAMSKSLITDTMLLLNGLEAAIYQLNNGGYKHRVLRYVDYTGSLISDENQERKNMLHLLKSFNLVLDAFERESLVKGLKKSNAQHDKKFIAKKEKLEKAYIDLLKLFNVFDAKCAAYQNKTISSEWLAIVGKIHFLAYDNSFVTSNHIGFSADFLSYHRGCICPQKGGNHPVRSILANANVSHTFTLGAEQVPLRAQEMLALGEVALDENKSSCSLELVTTGANKVAVVIRPYNSYLMHALLFISTSITVVMLGLLPAILANSLFYAIPAITLFGSVAYKLAGMVDKEINVGSFNVASPDLMKNSSPVIAADITYALGLDAFAKKPMDVDSDEEQIDISLDLLGRL